VAGTQVIKQADVVLLCHLLEDRIGTDAVARNLDYYEPRCDHASSLSLSTYALVAARLGRAGHALELLHRAADDPTGNLANAETGVHLANAAGSWRAVVLGPPASAPPPTPSRSGRGCCRAGSGCGSRSNGGAGGSSPSCARPAAPSTSRSTSSTTGTAPAGWSSSGSPSAGRSPSRGCRRATAGYPGSHERHQGPPRPQLRTPDPKARPWP
jgi:Glycosyl hydrolase family 65 central catalytic domain